MCLSSAQEAVAGSKPDQYSAEIRMSAAVLLWHEEAALCIIRGGVHSSTGTLCAYSGAIRWVPPAALQQREAPTSVTPLPPPPRQDYHLLQTPPAACCEAVTHSRQVQRIEVQSS
jgi:hypothetical protein